MQRIPSTLILPLLLAPLACAAAPGPGISGEAAATASSSRGYHPPELLNDGWNVADARDLGMDVERLEALTDAIRRASNPRGIHSLLLVRDGRLIYEQYFEGDDEHGRLGGLGHVVFDRDTRHDVRSVTKSVVSALVGIAVGSGAIRSLDQPILDFFPEHADLATPERRAITLRHLLEMTAGFAWKEWGYPYSDSANTAFRMNLAADPYRFVLEQPIVHPPGTRWTYNGGLTHLLAEVVRRSTGRPLVDYARENLFDPLGMTNVEWYNDRDRSTPDADSGLRMRPRDMARFGLLFAQRGEWNGRQIIPADWVDASLRRRIGVQDSVIEFGEAAIGEIGYGYQWFHGRYHMPYGRIDAHRAVGSGGQLVFIVPERRIVAVVTSGRYGDADDAQLVVLDRVLPLLLGATQPSYGMYEMPFRMAGPGELQEVALGPSERARYRGAYTQDGMQVRISDESGLLRIHGFPGLEHGTVHLIPLGDHVFAFGRYEGGRVTRIYWPTGRIEFLVDGSGRVTGYHDRSEDGHVFATGQRVR